MISQKFPLVPTIFWVSFQVSENFLHIPEPKTQNSSTTQCPIKDMVPSTIQPRLSSPSYRFRVSYLSLQRVQIVTHILHFKQSELRITQTTTTLITTTKKMPPPTLVCEFGVYCTVVCKIVMGLGAAGSLDGYMLLLHLIRVMAPN